MASVDENTLIFLKIDDSTWENVEMSLWFSMVIVLAVTLFILWKRKDENYPPGPFSWPLIGNTQLNKAHIQFTNLRVKYGDTLSVTIGRQKVVVLCSLDGILECLHYNGAAFANRPNCPVLRSLYKNEDKNKGFITADYDDKLEQKRNFLLDCLVGGTYAFEDDMEVRITGEVQDIVKKFLKESKPFNPMLHFIPSCLNMMLSLIFSQWHRNDEKDTNFQEILKSLCLRAQCLKQTFPDVIPMPSFLQKIRFKSVWERMRLQRDYQRKLINFHKDTFDPYMIRDLTDQLMMYVENGDDKGLFASDDMENLLLEISGSGFEETAITLTWLLGYMAMYPAVQGQVQKELDYVVGRDKDPCLDDQVLLPYTVATICEAQRMATVMPFLYPHQAVKKSMLQGYDIPKDTWVLCNVWSIHYDSKYWKNPKKFDPTRFLKDGKTVLIPDFFLPYGLGMRECPGQALATLEIFLYFSHILHHMIIRSADDTHSFYMEGELDSFLHHKPKPFLIKAIKRED